MDFIVLSSSRGTTFQAVIDRMHDGSLTARCLGLITDRPDRGCREKAEQAEIPVTVVERKKGEGREVYDRRLHEAIIQYCQPSLPSKNQKQEMNCCMIVCIGWMFLLSPWFVRQWKDCIINVHPSLLPKFPGAHAHEEVIASHEAESGMTIHFIDEGLDTGKIIEQKKCPVFPDDSVDSLKQRVQILECEWYPKVLQKMQEEETIPSP